MAGKAEKQVKTDGPDKAGKAGTAATASSAAKPAKAPNQMLLAPPMKKPRLAAKTSAQTRETPKTRATPIFSCASISPTARCQSFPNRSGEYQSPPTRKVLKTASTTASGLGGVMGIDSACSSEVARAIERFLPSRDAWLSGLSFRRLSGGSANHRGVRALKKVSGVAPAKLRNSLIMWA